MFDFLKRNKTTSLDKLYEDEEYLKRKLELAKDKGKAKAEAEFKEEKKELKTKPKGKSGFGKFQDYCTNFANNQPNIVGDINFGGNVNGKIKKSGKGSRPRTGSGLFGI